MPASHDIYWRLAADAAAAVVGFVAAILALRYALKAKKGGVYVTLAVYWLMLAGIAAPAVASAAFHANPAAAGPFTIAAFVLAVAAVYVGARKGHALAVLAAGGGLLLEWVLHILFAWIRDGILK